MWLKIEMCVFLNIDMSFSIANFFEIWIWITGLFYSILLMEILV